MNLELLAEEKQRMNLEVGVPVWKQKFSETRNIFILIPAKFRRGKGRVLHSPIIVIYLKI